VRRTSLISRANAGSRSATSSSSSSSSSSSVVGGGAAFIDRASPPPPLSPVSTCPPHLTSPPYNIASNLTASSSSSSSTSTSPRTLPSLSTSPTHTLILRKCSLLCEHFRCFRYYDSICLHGRRYYIAASARPSVYLSCALP